LHAARFLSAAACARFGADVFWHESRFR
jgi:hypothetical protein